MKHHIFSTTLKIEEGSEMVKIERGGLDRINEIQRNANTDIYLCGGGEFAGYLLDYGKIDQLKIKLNPIVLGKGTKLFGSSTSNANWELVDKASFADGLQILTYNRR